MYNLFEQQNENGQKFNEKNTETKIKTTIYYGRRRRKNMKCNRRR